MFARSEHDYLANVLGNPDICNDRSSCKLCPTAWPSPCRILYSICEVSWVPWPLFCLHLRDHRYRHRPRRNPRRLPCSSCSWILVSSYFPLSLVARWPTTPYVSKTHDASRSVVLFNSRLINWISSIVPVTLVYLFENVLVRGRRWAGNRLFASNWQTVVVSFRLGHVRELIRAGRQWPIDLSLLLLGFHAVAATVAGTPRLQHFREAKLERRQFDESLLLLLAVCRREKDRLILLLTRSENRISVLSREVISLQDSQARVRRLKFSYIYFKIKLKKGSARRYVWEMFWFGKYVFAFSERETLLCSCEITQPRRMHPLLTYWPSLRISVVDVPPLDLAHLRPTLQTPSLPLLLSPFRKGKVGGIEDDLRKDASDITLRRAASPLRKSHRKLYFHYRN